VVAPALVQSAFSCARTGRPDGCRARGHSGTLRRVESPDSVLAARLTAGDDRALAEVFDAHGPSLHRTALSVLGSSAAAEDVVQDVLVELWCHPHRYDPALGGLRTYLSLCARHHAYDVVRSELRRAGREERHRRLLPEPREATPAERLADAETASVVRDAVRTLPPDQREVVELAYFGGLSYRAVAHALGISEGTAKSRIRLALARLEGMLDRSLVEPS
jgi:RNA polymerase sigma-70 factor, ECF subfamily